MSKKTKKRGFALLSKAERSGIARLGGKASQKKARKARRASKA